MIPKLKDLYQNKDLMGDICVAGFLTYTNVDDIFVKIRSNGINEVKVDWDEMLKVVIFILANLGIKNDENIKWDALKIIQDGKINKFLGVKLKLYE